MAELGLEVRASRQNPSTINGEWNPVVKADLEARLRDSGCDLSESFLMLVRGSKTVLERERPHRSPLRAPWAWYAVRDCEVNLLDAIAHISWMRSHVAAHRLKPKFARALSVYDVSNAQGLAARLLSILSGCGRMRIIPDQPRSLALRRNRHLIHVRVRVGRVREA